MLFPDANDLDASALKALAHPLRIQLLGSLDREGPATANELGRRLGETSGATSYHIRQLARHGLVEEDVSRGRGRERWWRAMPGGFVLRGAEALGDAAARHAAAVVISEVHRGRAARVQRWFETLPDLPADWQGVGADVDYDLRLDAAQFKALLQELDAVIERHRATAADQPSETAAPVEIQLTAFPVR